MKEFNKCKNLRNDKFKIQKNQKNQKNLSNKKMSNRRNLEMENFQ